MSAIVYWDGKGPSGGGVGANNLDIPIGATPLKLQGLSGEIVFRPSPGVALTGTGTLGGRIRGVDRGELFNISATLSMLSLATQGNDPCSTPIKLSGTASLPLLEEAGGKGELGLKLCFGTLARPIQLTELGTTLNIVLPYDLASFRGSANGWYSKEAFAITGSAAVNLRRYPAAEGLVRDLQRRRGGVRQGRLDRGGRVLALGRARRHVEHLRPQRLHAGAAAESQAGAPVVRVPGNQRGFAIRVRGTGAAPVIRLTGPRGEVVDTAGATPVVTDRLIVDRDDARQMTTVILRRPRRGAWRIDSAQPIAGVATSRVKPRLSVRAHVRRAPADAAR